MDRTPQQIFWLILLLVMAATVMLLYGLIWAIGIGITKGEVRDRWKRTFKEQGITITAAVGLTICILGSIIAIATRAAGIYIPLLMLLIGFFVVLANSTGGARTYRRHTARVIPPNQTSVDDVRVLSPRSLADEFAAQKKTEMARTCVYSLLLVFGVITGVMLVMALMSCCLS